MNDNREWLQKLLEANEEHFINHRDVDYNIRKEEEEEEINNEDIHIHIPIKNDDLSPSESKQNITGNDENHYKISHDFRESNSHSIANPMRSSSSFPDNPPPIERPTKIIHIHLPLKDKNRLKLSEPTLNEDSNFSTSIHEIKDYNTTSVENQDEISKLLLISLPKEIIQNNYLYSKIKSYLNLVMNDLKGYFPNSNFLKYHLSLTDQETIKWKVANQTVFIYFPSEAFKAVNTNRLTYRNDKHQENNSKKEESSTQSSNTSDEMINIRPTPLSAPLLSPSPKNDVDLHFPFQESSSTTSSYESSSTTTTTMGMTTIKTQEMNKSTIKPLDLLPFKIGFLMVGGEYSNGSTSRDIFAHDGSQYCRKIKSFPHGLSRHMVEWYQNHILVCGGRGESKVPRKECFKYHGGDWERVNDLPKGIAEASFTHIGNKVYLTGGRTDQGEISNRSFVFININNETSWHSGVSLNQSRHSHCSFTYKSRIYLVGGEGALGKPLALVDMYDTTKAEGWKNLKGIKFPASNLGCTVDSSSGTVYVAAGHSIEIGKINQNNGSINWISTMKVPFEIELINPQINYINNHLVIIQGNNNDDKYGKLMTYNEKEGWSNYDLEKSLNNFVGLIHDNSNNLKCK